MNIKKLYCLTIIFAVSMIGTVHAELKTFGVPNDSQTEEVPAEEAPDEEAPSEEAPAEETPAEEAPAEEAPSEEAPSEEAPDDDEMPAASEDSQVSEDQPIKFKEEFLVSANIGTVIPFGGNLTEAFTGGLDFQVSVKTPFAFNLSSKTVSLNASLNMMSMATSGEWTDYTPMTVGVDLSTELFSGFSMYLGTGLAMSSGTTVESANNIEDYSMTTGFISGGAAYNLPISSLLEGKGSLENLNLSVYFKGIEIFGAPASEGTSDIITMGVSVGYPLLF